MLRSRGTGLASSGVVVEGVVLLQEEPHHEVGSPTHHEVGGDQSGPTTGWPGSDQVERQEFPFHRSREVLPVLYIEVFLTHCEGQV